MELQEDRQQSTYTFLFWLSCQLACKAGGDAGDRICLKERGEFSLNSAGGKR